MSVRDQNETTQIGVAILERKRSTTAVGKLDQHGKETAMTSPSNWAWSHDQRHFDWMDSYAPFADVSQADLTF